MHGNREEYSWEEETAAVTGVLRVTSETSFRRAGTTKSRLCYPINEYFPS